MILHVANASQVDPHTIRLVAVVYDDVRVLLVPCTRVTPPHTQFTVDLETLRSRGREDPACRGHLTELTLDVAARRVHRRQVAPLPCEFPTINNAFACTNGFLVCKHTSPS